MRKRPKQQRSRQMVETLLDATARCIAERGLDGTSTPIIAELAGVSVGSLYQYFESKEELIEALVERIASDVTRALDAGVRATGDIELDVMARTAIRVALALLHSNAGLYLELVRNWYRLPTHKVADVLQQYFLELLRVYFAKHHRDVQVQDLHVKSFIIVNSTIFTVVRFLSGDHPLMTEDDIANGLTEMITGYLLQNS
ncbi:MAG: TetR/AcrR family transcriptional regulator [Gammaproteobacteria bacterium]|nr:TetR/AcrR family transcriptional regulator [Gammaproteobacteria bacterium]